MSFDSARATASLERLARRHRVVTHWRPRKIQEAHVASRQIWTTPIEDGWDYLCALHELGHIVDRNARRLAETQLNLACEAAAWDWALAQADPEILPKVTKALRRKITECWESYLPGKL